MKNIIQNIAEHIRPPLLLLLTSIIAGDVTAQREQTLSDKSYKHAVGAESQSPAYVKNACGFYPAAGKWVRSISVLTAADGCTTTIMPGPGTVYFTARDRVILSPGFAAFDGSNFIAYVESEKGISASIILQDSAGSSAMANENLDEANQTVFIAPNPCSGLFTMSVNSAKDGKAYVIIYNSVGVKVKQQTGITISKGVNKISFNCSNFASGIYTVEIDFGETRIVRRLIKS